MAVAFGGVAFLILGGVFTIDSWIHRHHIGEPYTPGEGSIREASGVWIPFGIGLMLIVISVFMLWRAICDQPRA